MKIHKATHEAAEAEGARPQLVRHPHVQADFARRLQLAPRESVGEDVGVAIAVGDQHSIAEMLKLRQLLQLCKDRLHERGLGGLVGEAEGGGERVNLSHDEGVIWDVAPESFDLTVESCELGDGDRELELYGRKR